ncbi:MAG TPA: hypothetical protein VFI31_24145 [Pirellulales bacterium]|nr:hypothetical protein [Pirellulales bacterium]
MSAPLEHERRTYEEKKGELLANSAGKYVVIHGDEVAGVWDTQDDALRAGYERFKLEPFLVKQITEVERVHHLTRDVPICPA